MFNTVTKKVLDQILKNPNDRSTIYKLEQHLKSNWSNYSNKSFTSIVFYDTFSEILHKASRHEYKTVNQLTSDLRSLYDEKLADVKAQLTADIPYVPTIAHVDMLNVKNLSIKEKFLLYRRLREQEVFSDKETMLALTKVQINDAIDKSESEILQSCNFISLFLLSRLGFDEYKRFCKLVDVLGIYYPFLNNADEKLTFTLRQEFVKQLIDKIDVDNAEILEKMLMTMVI